MSLGRHKIGVPSMIGAQALDSHGDPHLADGIHFRIATGLLGLPGRPLDVFRLNLGRGANFPGVRREARWRDARKRTIAAPFTLGASNPRAEALLPPPSIAQCCWLEILTSGPANLRVEAVVQDAGVVATRTSPPFALTATAINKVLVTGSGQITGIRWIAVEDVWNEAVRREQLPENDPQHLAVWRRLALPVDNAAHYVDAIQDPVATAFQRVSRGAPRRMGLHDDPDASGPADAKLFDAVDRKPKEKERIADFADQLIEYVEQLVASDDPETLTTDETFPDVEGGLSFDIPLLDAVMEVLVDPGVAKFLGYADVDEQPLSTAANDVLVYVVAGIWGRRNDPTSTQSGVVQLSTVACAVVRHPPDPPGKLNMHAPIGGVWLPATPPAAIRHITLPISRFVAGAMIALTRQQSPGNFLSLNGISEPSLRARGLLPNIEGLSIADKAEFLDKEGPPHETLYRSAQHDWFGRWSEWAQRLAAAGIRPPPPKPVLDARYNQPDFGLPTPLSPLAGTITFEVPIPPKESLSPASHLLSSLELDVDGVVQTFALPVNEETIIDDLPGPPVPRNGEVEVTLTARWVNTEGDRSVPSNPRTLLLRDPRPPLVVTFPPGLRYTARPDARGRARMTLNWSSQPGQAHFRVFYTDELRLIDGLQEIAADGTANSAQAQAALDTLDTETNPAERAQTFEGVAGLFPRARFEQITQTPLDAPAAGTALSLEHDVPGDLEVLSFYRVVAVSSAQVEAIFEDATLLPVRVPNSLVAPRPSLSVEPRFNEQRSQFEARIQVTVPAGNVRASQYRLRRTIGLQRDANSMPVVTVQGIGPPNSGNVQVGEFVDTGASELSAATRFLPWHRYVWQADVRGAREAGAGPQARWSEPGGPVAHLFIPENPPPAPTLMAVESDAAGNKVTVAYAGPVNGGEVGPYSLRVFRETGNTPPELAGRVFMDETAEASGNFVFVDSGVDSIDVAYRAVVEDPLGRVSPSSAAASPGDDNG